MRLRKIDKLLLEWALYWRGLYDDAPFTLEDARAAHGNDGDVLSSLNNLTAWSLLVMVPLPGKGRTYTLNPMHGNNERWLTKLIGTARTR